MYNISNVKYEMLERINDVQKELDWSFNCSRIDEDILEEMSVSKLAYLLSAMEAVLQKYQTARDEWSGIYEGYVEGKKSMVGAKIK